jgi:hypothetical protein
MKLIRREIYDLLIDNKIELKERMQEIAKIKNLLLENDVKFDVLFKYDNVKDCLKVDYNFYSNKLDKEMDIDFLIDENVFWWNSTDITCTSIEYAVSYFNNTEFKVNIGGFDGDNYVTTIEEYLKEYCLDNEKIEVFKE